LLLKCQELHGKCSCPSSLCTWCTGKRQARTGRLFKCYIFHFHWASKPDILRP
jgi:hypothetical protein